jgi:hypothetical protein
VKTAIYEADAFTGSKGEHYTTIDSDYRFEKGDEIWVEYSGGKKVKLRVTWINVTVRWDGTVERELLGLKL